jgi:hypothetical protein
MATLRLHARYAGGPPAEVQQEGPRRITDLIRIAAAPLYDRFPRTDLLQEEAIRRIDDRRATVADRLC